MITDFETLRQLILDANIEGIHFELEKIRVDIAKNTEALNRMEKTLVEMMISKPKKDTDPDSLLD